MVVSIGTSMPDEWHENRRRGIGSSDAAACCGIDPHRTPLHVWADKRGLWKQPDNPAMRRGRLLEPIVAQMYEEETGDGLIDPNGKTIAHPMHPWKLATVDRFRADGTGIVEIKTVRQLRQGVDDWGEPGTDQIPHHYLCQVMHQMDVTGHKSAEVVVLVGGEELLIYKVKFNETLAVMIHDQCFEMWKRVQENSLPEPDWRHHETIAILEALYQPTTEKHTIYDSSVEELAGIYSDCKAIARKMEREAEEAKGRIILKMGNAETCFAGRYTIKRKLVQRKGYSVEPSQHYRFDVVEIEN